MTFQLDTSGVVFTARPIPDQPRPRTAWSDLSPFVQGYIEAMAKAWFDEGAASDTAPIMDMRFSDLAPATLARIIEDCERFHGPDYNVPPSVEKGRNFWIDRQNGVWARNGFPPLAPHLGDDGRVYFR